MGEVVSLERVASRRGAGRRRARRARTALVLAGGGFTGGVYEIGALRALDLLSVNRRVGDFDVFVGTSTGALVAALAANGVTPDAMMRVVNGQVPPPLRDLDVGTVRRPNARELLARSALRPGRAAGVLRERLPKRGRGASVMDLVLGLGEAMPSGMYSGRSLEHYVRGVLADADRTDDFRALDRRLLVPATDLDTCERVVLGGEGFEDVPISTAVRASTALPMVFAPVEVKGRELVDGGVVSTTNVDLAVAAGARLVVVVNPLVPFVNDLSKPIGTVGGARPRRVSQLGLPQIGFQTYKLMAYQRLHETAQHWEERYPGVDIVLIEPEPDDELMFQTAITDAGARVAIARHGFEAVTARLADDHADLRAIAERHGIEISASRVRRVVRHFAEERPGTHGWRRILEQTTGALLRQAAPERQ